jgi:hypothetical protein
MKPSLLREIIFGIIAFLLLSLVMIMGGAVPQFVYVMF